MRGKKENLQTYNRSRESVIILLKLLQRILCVAGTLDQLCNSICCLLTLATYTANRRDVIEDTAQLVCGRGRSGNL